MPEQNKIESQFVDFEIAKMLKELAFDAECRDYYDENGELTKCVHYKDGLFISFKNSDELYTTAPSWQDIEQWLWEKHEIVIRVIYDSKIFHSIVGRKNFSVIDTLGVDFDSPITAKIEGIKSAIKHLHSKK